MALPRDVLLMVLSPDLAMNVARLEQWTRYREDKPFRVGLVARAQQSRALVARFPETMVSAMLPIRYVGDKGVILSMDAAAGTVVVLFETNQLVVVRRNLPVYQQLNVASFTITVDGLFMMTTDVGVAGFFRLVDLTLNKVVSKMPNDADLSVSCLGSRILLHNPDGRYATSPPVYPAVWTMWPVTEVQLGFAANSTQCLTVGREDALMLRDLQGRVLAGPIPMPFELQWFTGTGFYLGEGGRIIVREFDRLAERVGEAWVPLYTGLSTEHQFVDPNDPSRAVGIEGTWVAVSRNGAPPRWADVRAPVVADVYWTREGALFHTAEVVFYWKF